MLRKLGHNHLSKEVEKIIKSVSANGNFHFLYLPIK